MSRYTRNQKNNDEGYHSSFYPTERIRHTTSNASRTLYGHNVYDTIYQSQYQSGANDYNRCSMSYVNSTYSNYTHPCSSGPYNLSHNDRSFDMNSHNPSVSVCPVGAGASGYFEQQEIYKNQSGW